MRRAMAIVQMPDASRLVLTLDDGVDNEGNPQTKTKSFNNVKPEASDEALYRVATSLAQLQTLALVSVDRHDRAELVEDGQ